MSTQLVLASSKNPYTDCLEQTADEYLNWHNYPHTFYDPGGYHYLKDATQQEAASNDPNSAYNRDIENNTFGAVASNNLRDLVHVDIDETGNPTVFISTAFKPEDKDVDEWLPEVANDITTLAKAFTTGGPYYGGFHRPTLGSILDPASRTLLDGFNGRAPPEGKERAMAAWRAEATNHALEKKKIAYANLSRLPLMTDLAPTVVEPVGNPVKSEFRITGRDLFTARDIISGWTEVKRQEMEGRRQLPQNQNRDPEQDPSPFITSRATMLARSEASRKLASQLLRDKAAGMSSPGDLGGCDVTDVFMLPRGTTVDSYNSRDGLEDQPGNPAITGRTWTFQGMNSERKDVWPSASTFGAATDPDYRDNQLTAAGRLEELAEWKDMKRRDPVLSKYT
ncbi:uncharacterized protein L203_104124 [Cryptococcus depauperatus CBS 7841]|uniref:Uncharacterized protein n=1 Tax=Cryptococcus depauperatus CBS 7841 TaxID=1295531 RepID=A0AAJ8JV66_9TREE